MGRPHCLFGLQQVFGEPIQHLLLRQEFIHDERCNLREWPPPAESSLDLRLLRDLKCVVNLDAKYLTMPLCG